ncbi:hypothetical protein PanWU01x14_320330, partial [Parasponia andersonii]
NKYYFYFINSCTISYLHSLHFSKYQFLE